MATKRIYLVISGDNERLIEAANKSQALSYAARTTYSAAVASQLDLVRLLKDGTAVESVDDDGQDAGA